MNQSNYMAHLMSIKPTIMQCEVSKQHLAADSLQNAFKSCKHAQKTVVSIRLWKPPMFQVSSASQVLTEPSR